MNNIAKRSLMFVITALASIMAFTVATSTQASAQWAYAVQTATISVPGATTYYSGGVYRSPGTSQNESAVELALPSPFTASRLYVHTHGAQPGNGTVIITVRKNNVDDVLTITIPAGASAGSFWDTTHTVSYVAGDVFTVSIASTCPVGTVSAPIDEVALQFQ